ncbi:DNA phosphorothioation system sulfurtransferase DndC [Rhizorhabdus dicambivorans]|uniref:DNA phosphorothioation system sulfurtransferase DndC n=1 Tax=Rhizorhabdus dicambivorans TaxID=1850238 RepID=A0A2A4FS98_9SPHN|nr:DNA phosphorothioation system sulfurtransferase DndC [Rhizorhabdus dicambivorans]ATE65675.1 DNA phosphorothioation system sulfurtransferase DndC [Rhizorhabdus dicambivorans]PCE41019.1 DNA phosphorothioation system sulfurtransferase DndC [Rhizorhabdus dicambivorans]
MAKVSALDGTGLADRYREIREVYLSDNRPWVVGYSGGKDSTCALQMLWTALLELPVEQRQKPIYVISSDTLVETPVIVRYIDVTLERIARAAAEQGLPIKTEKVTPNVDRSFWVNMIGRGYPAPSRRFRWCTERLKIEPANDFIRGRVAEFGEVVMVLGVRTSESATRAQVMSFHKIKGSALSRHSSLLNAFVYAPIEPFSTDDVWTYLLQHPSPWGNDNRDLVAMYRNAQAGECPLVVDTTTPSCGNSRFGCWVCTVVERDRSMEAMIDSGEDWLEPLLDFRDMLAETQLPEKKKLYREFRRRSGQVAFIKGTDTPVPGPYTLDFCKTLLKRLLETQLKVQREAPPGDDTLLVHDAELHEIRRIWRAERGDWADSVPLIVRETLGRDLDWVIEDSIAFTADDGRLLDELCRDRDVPTELVIKLLDVERAAHGLKRRHAVHTRIEDLFRQEWRDLDAVLEERLAGRQADEVEGDEELEALAMQPALDFDKDVSA